MKLTLGVGVPPRLRAQKSRRWADQAPTVLLAGVNGGGTHWLTEEGVPRSPASSQG